MRSTKFSYDDIDAGLLGDNIKCKVTYKGNEPSYMIYVSIEPNLPQPSWDSRDGQYADLIISGPTKEEAVERLTSVLRTSLRRLRRTAAIINDYSCLLKMITAGAEE